MRRSMIHGFLTALFLVAEFALAAPGPAEVRNPRATELLKNPGFDLDADRNGLPDGWNTSAKRIRWREKQYMSHDYVLISRPSEYVLATQDIRLVPGKRYTITLRVKTENGGLAGALIVHGADKPRREMPLIWRAETGPDFEDIVRTFIAPNPIARLYIYNVAKTEGTVYYDRVSIHEGTPDFPVISQLSLRRIDRPVTPPPETPHIPWATPLAGGPLKGFITLRSLRCLRQVLELAERIDLDDDVVVTGYKGDMAVSETGRRVMTRLKDRYYEVYVVPSRVSDALAKAIRERVQGGAGLVVIEGFGVAKRFADIKALRKVSNDHFLLRDTIPLLMPTRIQTSLEIGRLGKGRVARLVFPLDSSRVWGLMPSENDKVAWKSRQFEYWEWWESLLAKAVLWAGRGAPGVRLRFAESATGGVDITTSGAPSGARVQVLVRSGREIRFDGPLLRSGPTVLPLGKNGSHHVSIPPDFPAGPVIIDAMILDSRGKALTWGSTVVRTPQAVRITDLIADPTVIEPGQSTLVTVKLHSERTCRGMIAGKLIDAFNRVVARSTIDRALPAGDASVTLCLPVRAPLCVLHRVFVRVAVAGREQDCRWMSITVPSVAPRRAAADFLAMPWGPGMTTPPIWGYYALQTRKLGLNGMFTGAYFLTDETGLFGGGYVGGMGTFFRETRHSPEGVRPHCLSDPGNINKIRRKTREAATAQKPFGPFAVGITDEAFLSSRHKRSEVCFSKHCQARYRQWLRKQYGTLPALNLEWGTMYHAWDEIRGVRTEEIRGKANFAPFVDFRTFMTDVWIDACRQVVDSYHEVAPGTPIGHTNTFGANPFNGNDYWKLCTRVGFGWGQEYSEAIKGSAHKAIFDLWRSFCETPEAQASRTPPGQPVRPFFNYGWIGYHHSRTAAHYEPWWLALHGSRGVSYFATNAMAAERNVSYALVYPSLNFTPYSKAVSEALFDLRGGCGKVLIEFQREQPRIALLWSHSSMLVAWCESEWDEPVPDEHDGTDAYGSYFRSALFFRHHLNELQLDYTYVAPEQILRDNILEHYPLLILPFAVAASPELVACLTAYVRNGGVLVGDLRCLRTDAHGKPVPDAAALEPLFGVRRTGDPVDYSPTKIVFQRTGEGIDLHGNAIASFGREGVVPAGATPLARHASGEGAVFVHRLGKGLTVYFNFGLPEYDASLRELLRQLTARAGISRPVVAEALKPGGPPPRCYERDTFRRGPIAVHGFIRDYRRCSDTTPVRIHFADTAYVYDMRARKYIGHTNTVETTLPPGETALYACLPYRAQGVAVSAPARVETGAAFEITARVDAGGQRASGHVFHMELLDPKGRVIRPYTTNVLAETGCATVRVPLARNDPPGTWTVRVRDVLTGNAVGTSFEVQAPPGER